MDACSPGDMSVILDTDPRNEAAALDRLVPLLYDELRQVARRAMAGAPPGQTLQPTALVHEAWMRLAGKDAPTWENRRHFFFAATRAMHDVLVERARAKAAVRRGGDRKRMALEDWALPLELPSDSVLELHEALERLGREDPDGRRVVELRYFAGLSARETADVMGVSLSTVERSWRLARARLHAELSTGAALPEAGMASPLQAESA